MSMHTVGGAPLTGYEPTADHITAETIAAFHELLDTAPTGDDPWTGVDVTDWDEYELVLELTQPMARRHRVRKFARGDA